MGIYEVAQDVLHEPIDGRLSSVAKFKEVRNTVGALGSDTTLLNDALFENYSSSAKYFDMDFEKTASFLDLISQADLADAYVGKTQNYEAKSFAYLPAANFKMTCAAEKKNRFEYPTMLRKVRQELNESEDLVNSLLDVK